MRDMERLANIIRYWMFGIAVHAVTVLFVMIMAVGVLDNIRHALSKKDRGAEDVPAERTGRVLNTISAGVLCIPIVLAVLFIFLRNGVIR